MKAEIGMSMIGPVEQRMELNPWLLSQIIQQGKILQKTGAELQQYIREQIEDNLLLGGATSDASKHDELKKHALSNDAGFDVVLEQLKKSDLSQVDINVYLEVLAEKCVKAGLTEDAQRFANEITDDEVRRSIAFQLEKLEK